jgi:uncharacterized membrane protein
MDKKTASWFAYLLSALSAIIVLVMVKDDKEVRTHAWQSLFLSCLIYVIAIILAIISGIAVAASPFSAFAIAATISTISLIFWLAYIAVVVICIIKAVQGGIFKIPGIYNLALKMK